MTKGKKAPTISESLMRKVALEFANNVHESHEEVVKRAEAYLKFLKG